MPTAREFHEQMRAVPFRPFRIVTAFGTTFDIARPDAMMATENVLYIGVFEPHDSLIPDRAESVSIVHVTDIQPLYDSPSTPSS